MADITYTIWCCYCREDVEALRTSGKEIFPHKHFLHDLSFWQCPACGNYVGSHKKEGTPLGTIPTSAIARLRQDVHRVLDPMWKNGKWKRGVLYKEMALRLPHLVNHHGQFHVGELSTEAACRSAFNTARDIADGVKRGEDRKRKPGWWKGEKT